MSSCNCGDSRCCVCQKGERGLKGYTGLQGSTGPQGPAGSDGNNGANGSDGDKGDPGIQGNTGGQGNPGIQGDPGNPGLTGPQGDPGTPGPAGVEYDSGWKNIPEYSVGTGFGIAPLTIGTVVPQFRIVNRVVMINGLYPLPLATDATGLTLNTDLTSYSSANRPWLYLGNDGGFEEIFQGRMELNSPILPQTLWPEITQYANKQAGNTIYRSIDVNNPPSATQERYILKAFCPQTYILPTGKLGFTPAISWDGFGDPAKGLPSSVRLDSSKFTAGDFPPDYSVYESGFTGVTDNRIIGPATYSIPYTMDMNLGPQMGGCYIYFNFDYHIDLTTSIDDIIIAFDSIPY